MPWPTSTGLLFCIDVDGGAFRVKGGLENVQVHPYYCSIMIIFSYRCYPFIRLFHNM